MTANNVIDFTKYRAKANTDVYVPDNWTLLHTMEYQAKLNQLIADGVIDTCNVEINEHGIPIVYLTTNSEYNITTNVPTPEANNT